MKGEIIVKEIVIIYWSGTGNTEMMAEAILEGAKNQSKVSLINVEDATVNDVISADAVALGCPSMGAEVLEEGTMEPFIESLENVDFSEKPVALFGSYDWGDGQWMHDWENRMKGYGAKLVDKGLIINLTPNEEDLEQCRELGKKLVE